MEYYAGIDLGTTNTVCAVCSRSQPAPRILPISQPQASFEASEFRADPERPELPSAVGVFAGDRRRCYVGRAVKKHATFGAVPGLGQLHSFLSIKRAMGTEGPENELGWVPEQVSACILRAVRDELLRGHGNKEPRGVVITVPASFSTESRGATMAAAAMAGFDPNTVRLLDEPTAALISELDGPLQQALAARADQTRPLRVMVIDIGGGTLDVAIVEAARHGERVVLDVLGRSRKTDLAGDDFDLDIAAMLFEKHLKPERGISLDALPAQAAVNLCADLLSQAEAVKIALSRRLAVTRRPEEWQGMQELVTITCTPDRVPWQTVVNGRQLLEALARFFRPPADPRQIRTDDFTFYRAILDAIESLNRTLGPAAAASTGDVEGSIDHVWLTGGSARLPFMVDAVERLYPRAKSRLMQFLDHGVALGAARFAANGTDPPFDPRHRIELVERMYDGIYIETHSQHLAELVPPSQGVPIRFGDLAPIELRMPAPTRQLELAAYLGDSAEDPLMSPLLHCSVDLGAVLDEGDPVRLSLEVSFDREVRFRFVPFRGGEALPAVTDSGGRRWWSRRVARFAPPQVNPLPGGSR